MQDSHYKLILIVALLACAVPTFLGYDSYQQVKDARINMQAAFLEQDTPEQLQFQQYVFEIKDSILAYVMFNSVALISLLLIVMYLANRTYFAELALVKKQGDIHD